MAERLRLAQSAVPLLVSEFDNWRRSKVDDPEDRRGTKRDVLAATAEGLVLDDKGAQRQVPWSAFGGKTDALDTLFENRLSRDYTAAELRSIAALMHFSALTEALVGAGEMFTTGDDSVFTESEAQELPVAFERALEWCEDADERALLERDREASVVLGRALERASDGAWTTAVSALERLPRDYPDTWLVRLLSDRSEIGIPR